jgi:hypothetical protein
MLFKNFISEIRRKAVRKIHLGEYGLAAGKQFLEPTRARDVVSVHVRVHHVPQQQQILFHTFALSEAL